MKNSPMIIVLILIVFFICGKTTTAQTVSGAITEKTLRRGKPANGKIILSIPTDLHINSNKPIDEFLIPTSVKFTDPKVKIGKIIYPKARLQKFEFSEKPLSIYDGQITIKFTFLVPANFRKEILNIKASIQFQACNQEVCFPPKTEKITLSAKIK